MSDKLQIKMQDSHGELSYVCQANEETGYMASYEYLIAMMNFYEKIGYCNPVKIEMSGITIKWDRDIGVWVE
jgi:hypothetical protein